MQVFVVDDLVEIAHRRAGHALGHQPLEQRCLACVRGEARDQCVHLVHVLDAVLPIESKRGSSSSSSRSIALSSACQWLSR